MQWEDSKRQSWRCDGRANEEEEEEEEEEESQKGQTNSSKHGSKRRDATKDPEGTKFVIDYTAKPSNLSFSRRYKFGNPAA